MIDPANFHRDENFRAIDMDAKTLRARQKEVMNELEQLSLIKPNLFVDMVEDYVADSRLCLTAAAFIAEPYRNEVHTLVQTLESIDARHHFYTPESFHITIQNVRTISDPPTFSDDDVPHVSAVFEKVLAACPPFNIELNGFLKLPTSLAIRAYTDQRFSDLISELRIALAAAGYADNKAYVNKDVIFANLTICRYKSEVSAELIAALDALAKHIPAMLQISEVCLISTNAVCHPSSTKVWSRYRLSSK